MNTLLIEGEQMLIDMTWIHRVPSVQFRHRTEVYEPVHLDGLPQVSRCMGRDPSTHISNLLQLRLALRVTLLGGHLLRQFGMPLCEENCRITRDGHCLQLLLFVCCLRIMNIVKTVNPPLYPSLHV